VLDLAVAVIIGAAFGAIVTSLNEDVIMPVIGAIFGGADFSNQFVRLGPIPASFKGDLNSYVALKEAGVAMIGYGSLVTALINFMIVAFVIFLLVRQANKLIAKPAEATAGPTEIELLAEIRDELRKRA
jgi:large conductance mechanosensitive channel